MGSPGHSEHGAEGRVTGFEVEWGPEHVELWRPR